MAFRPEIADVAQSCLGSMPAMIFRELFFVEVIVVQKMDFFFWSEMNLSVPFQQRIKPGGAGLHCPNT